MSSKGPMYSIVPKEGERMKGFSQRLGDTQPPIPRVAKHSELSALPRRSDTKFNAKFQRRVKRTSKKKKPAKKLFVTSTVSVQKTIRQFVSSCRGSMLPPPISTHDAAVHAGSNPSNVTSLNGTMATDDKTCHGGELINGISITLHPTMKWQDTPRVNALQSNVSTIHTSMARKQLHIELQVILDCKSCAATSTCE